MKMMKVLVAAVVMAAIATPALAEFKLNGYFRTKMYSLERKSATDSEGVSQQNVDQRLRMKATYTLNDNVSVVYYGEVDYLWGNGAATTGRQLGGGVGADTVNMETKNAFVNVKFDNTNIVLGTQTIGDAYGWLVFLDDMSGVTATQKFGATTLTAAYAKWAEGANTSWDDTDFYVVDLKQKLGDTMSVGGSLYFLDDNGAADAEVIILGVNGDFKAGPLDMSAFLILQDGEFQATSTDHQAMAFSVKGAMKFDGGSLAVRYLYISDDDDASDNGKWIGNQGVYANAGDGMMIFFYDAYYTNSGAENYALADAVNGGYGLHALTAAASFTLPDSMYAKCGAGLFMAASDEADDSGMTREGEMLGYEVNARFGKKFFEKVDVSINAAYAGFGDFYDGTAGGDDPDGIYKAYAMVNVPF